MHFDIRKLKHIRSAISVDLISELYESAKRAKILPATVGKIVNGTYTTEYSKWCTANFVDYDNFSDKVTVATNQCRSIIEKLYDIQCVDSEIHFLHYTDGTYYHSHIDGQYVQDDIAKRGIDRDITCVIYLNDDYDGGEINFNFFNHKLKPKKSDILIYPTTFEFVHSVDKVIGDRYAIVVWFKTDPLMNVDIVIKDPSIIKFLQRITSG